MSLGTFLNKKRSPVGLAIVLLGAYAWMECRPLPWAEDLAKEEVESCYAKTDPPCLSLRDSEDQYGPALTHHIVKVGRGLSNTKYQVTVDVDRAQAKTRETFAVYSAYASKLERRVASIWNVTTERR